MLCVLVVPKAIVLRRVVYFSSFARNLLSQPSVLCLLQSNKQQGYGGCCYFVANQSIVFAGSAHANTHSGTCLCLVGKSGQTTTRGWRSCAFVPCRLE
uniref:Putative secreted protein n=1 Tax=Anopheles triannulatus TaxID=58253 RepID=A0A2M4B2F2_9DIPT